jgi:hypothetical protein
MIDLEITLKSIDCTYKQSFIVARDISLDYDSEGLQSLVKSAQSNAKFVPETTTIKLSFKL